jgi:hypothetical protein
MKYDLPHEKNASHFNELGPSQLLAEKMPYPRGQTVGSLIKIDAHGDLASD